jgi:hypothetical protein
LRIHNHTTAGKITEQSISEILMFLVLCCFILVPSAAINSGVLISLLFFLLYVVVSKRIFLPKRNTFKFYALAVAFFALIGVSNPVWFLDLKYHIYLLYGIIVLNTFLYSASSHSIIISITWVNVIVLLVYLALTLKLVDNFYIDAEGIAEYKNYKVPGPSTILTFYVPLFYLWIGRTRDKYLFINFIISIIVCLINANLQNFIISLSIYTIYLWRFGFSSLAKTLLVSIFLLIIINEVGKQIISEKYWNKLSEVFKPMESLTVQTRIADLTFMIQSGEPTNKLIGDGIGVSSTVYRYNPFVPQLSSYETFLEIDNGFYYVYHRAGLLGLLGFLIFHFFCLRRLKKYKLKFMYSFFFIITNLLSIHYFAIPAVAFFLTILFLPNMERVNIMRHSTYKLEAIRRSRTLLGGEV